jgi:hypothetical protein
MLRVLKRLWRALMPDEPITGNAVADAMLMLAVEKWAKDFRHHIELAQVAKQELASGWESGAMEEDARQAFIACIKAKKSR